MPDLTHPTRLARNSFLTLGTSVFLAAATVVVVPLMLHGFGRDLYGLLILTWMVLAHLGWLDFGLSRATAKYVAADLVNDRRVSAAHWARAALMTQIVLGAAGGLLVWLLAPQIAHSVHIGQNISGTAVTTLRLFAVAVPVELAGRSLTGVLQAGQRFVFLNSLQLAGTLASYGFYAVGIWRDSFMTVVVGLFAVRLVNAAGLFIAAARVVPLLSAPYRKLRSAARARSYLREMLRFGSWITVASLLGPLILYFDQWIISVYLGVATLPYYAIPFNALSRLFVFPLSLAQTLFPAFSALEARKARDRVEMYFVRANRFLCVLLVPVLFLLFVWAPEILRVWIGDDFASHAAGPFRILVCGFAIGLLAPLTGALLEGVGRPDVVAKLYVVELPINIGLVVLLTRAFGITGAAVSYSARTLIETALLWLVAARVIRFSGAAMQLALVSIRQMGALMLALAAAAAIFAEIGGAVAVASTAGIVSLYLAVAGLLVLDRSDRKTLRDALSRPAAGALPPAGA